MFRTVSVHLQEQSFYKLYVIFGMCGYDIQHFMNLVDLYTYFKMVHSSCNIRQQKELMLFGEYTDKLIK